MTFSDDDIAEIYKVLQDIKIEKDDKFGIMACAASGDLAHHFNHYMLREVDANDNDFLKSVDELVINYFTNTMAKKYLNFMPEHIKNYILANSL